MRAHAFRLTPGTDLKGELERITRKQALSAGVILSGVGSLATARLRMPGAIGTESAYRTFDGPLEIVSLMGTLSPDGLHLHISLAGPDGACVGGHLVNGCIVHTTAELVIGEADGLTFGRTPDAVTGFRELTVEERPVSNSKYFPQGAPCLISFSGLPGVGKTTLARGVAASTGAMFLRIDDIEQTVQRSLGDAEVGAAGYAAAQSIAHANLKLGRSVVADCVNALEESRIAWRETAGRASAHIVEVEVICSDREEHHRRVTTRQADIPGHILPTWSSILSGDYQAWNTPVLVIDTAVLSPSEAVEAVVRAMRTLPAGAHENGPGSLPDREVGSTSTEPSRA